MQISRYFFYSILSLIFTFLNQFNILSAATPEQIAKEQKAAAAFKKSQNIVNRDKDQKITYINFTESGDETPFRSNYDLGNKAGQLSVRYDMYEVPDKLSVYVNGRYRGGTGGPVQGASYLMPIPIEKNLTGNNVLSIEVNWLGGLSGTAWNIEGTFSAAPLDNMSEALHSQNHWDREDSQHADPVDTATGAYLMKKTLLSLQGAIPLDFTVEYNSRLTFNGIMGRGWSHNYEPRLEFLENGNIHLWWDSKRRNTFEKNKRNVNQFQSDDLSMKFHELTRNSDGTYTLKDPKTQMAHHFNASGQLIQVKNAKGQDINLTYATPTDLSPSTIQEPISGVGFTLTYNEYGRLTNVVDSIGRSIVFEQDINDDLITIAKQDSYTLYYAYNYYGQMLTESDDLGLILENSYDELGRVISQDDGRTDNQLTEFFYDEQSKLKKRKIKKKLKKGKPINVNRIVTQVIDRSNQSHIYVHDKDLRLTSYEDQLGNEMRFRYNRKGQRIRATDPERRTARYKYDKRGRLKGLNALKGNNFRMDYDDRDNMIASRHARNKSSQYNYDSANNLVSATDAEGNNTQISYTPQGLLQSLASPMGGSTTYSYDKGLPVAITDAAGNTSQLTYDGAGRVMSIQDAEGYTTQFFYDVNDNVTNVIDPLGNSTLYVYDTRNNLISETDPLGNITTYTYSPNNRPETVTNALGGVIQFEYDSSDRIAKITNPLGNTTSFQRDEAGRLNGVADALGNQNRYTLDKAGNITDYTDALGNEILQIKYNKDALPKRMVNALGYRNKLSYDKTGQLKRIKDAERQSTRFKYDQLNRLVSTKAPAKQRTEQSFDKDGNLTQMINPLGQALTFQYDVAKRITSMATALGNQTTYTYNKRNLIETITDPLGNKTTFTYDPARRLIQIEDPTGLTTNSYDNKGRLLTTTYQTQTIDRQYDALDRLISFTDANGNTIQYSYDAVGNLIQLTYPDGKQVAYAYDAANRLQSVTDWANRTTTYQYDANGRLVQTQHANGAEEKRTYDKVGQLTQAIATAASGVLIRQCDYTYDKVGQITDEKIDPAPASYVPPANIAITYDKDNRLKSYNNQPATFDANGNLTSIASMGDYNYDARNRLSSTGGTTYTYDAEDRRIAMQDASGTTQFVIDPNAQFSRTLVRITPDGKTHYYVYGLGLLYEETDGQTYTHHYDYRGSTIAISDDSGSAIGKISYGPFGEIAAKEGHTETPFLYCGFYGVQTDPNGLYHMRARYYSADIKRFLNQDTVLGTSQFPITLNRFAYANNNPIYYVDPSGNIAFIAPILWGLGGVGARTVGGNILRRVVVGEAISTLTDTDTETTLSTLRGLGNAMAAGTYAGSILNTVMSSDDYCPEKEEEEKRKERERCKEVKNECIEDCGGEVGRYPYGNRFPFDICVNECLEGNNCLGRPLSLDDFSWGRGPKPGDPRWR